LRQNTLAATRDEFDRLQKKHPNVADISAAFVPKHPFEVSKSHDFQHFSKIFPKTRSRFHRGSRLLQKGLEQHPDSQPDCGQTAMPLFAKTTITASW
jgi:hypothetical protein